MHDVNEVYPELNREEIQVLGLLIFWYQMLSRREKNILLELITKGSYAEEVLEGRFEK